MKALLSCPLTFVKTKFEEDLIILDLQFYDVILGMDLLSLFCAIAECNLRHVWLRSQDDNIAMVSADQCLQFATSSLRVCFCGCRNFAAFSFMANLKVSSEDCSDLLGLLEEYADVFPEELPGLPPYREVKFTIELQPGTSSISIAPYQMVKMLLFRERPPEFKGLTDSRSADEWVTELILLLESIDTPEDLKARIASHYLTCESERWWKVLKRS